jgi:NADH-quinone oxidoreductase subunit A
VSSIELWPFALFLVLAILVVSGMMLFSALLGQRHSGGAADETYECGVASTGSARMRSSAKFYLMAMFFVVFDLEAVFIYAYAIVFPELGWSGFDEIFVFIFILGAALFYLWRTGALQWGPGRSPAGCNVPPGTAVATGLRTNATGG